MFKHILIPTDGSELSTLAVKNGVQFAKEINAKITGLTVTMPYHYFAVEAIQVSDTPRVNWFTNKCCMESTAPHFVLDIPPHTRYKSGCAIRFIHKRRPLRAPCSPSRTA